MKTLLLILQIIPALIGVITAVEAAIPGAGQGEAKLAAIKEMMIAVDSEVDNIWAPLTAVITILVNLFNKLGIFNKG